MKIKNRKFALFLVLAVVAAAALVWYGMQAREQGQFESRNADITITRPALGLEFSYTAGPEALSMVEPPLDGQPLLGAFILMPSREYVAFANGEDEDVGPTISMFVFRYSDQEMPAEIEQLSKREKLLAWAQENQSLTRINSTTTDVIETEIDGLTGIEYSADGNYQQDFKLFRLGDLHYMFVGQHLRDGDEMDEYFDQVLATVRIN